MVELKGLMTSTPGQDRHTGFREGIQGTAIEVIFEADMKWLEGDARSEMESALARFDDIDLVYAHNDPGAHGAYLAAKAQGAARDIKFVGIDALPHEGVMYVKQGILDATFQYPTGGAEAIDIALRILRGETVPEEVARFAQAGVAHVAAERGLLVQLPGQGDDHRGLQVGGVEIVGARGHGGGEQQRHLRQSRGSLTAAAW